MSTPVLKIKVTKGANVLFFLIHLHLLSSNTVASNQNRWEGLKKGHS